MSNANLKAAGAACLMLALTGCGQQPPASTEPALPDWSGGWASMRQALLDSNAALDQVIKPEGLATLKKRRADSASNQLDIRPAYCPMPTFGGYSGGFHGSLEFLYTPGRVTVIWEGGLVRRIFTDGRALPDNPEPTDAGTSVGHWEGQTLVVKTNGLRPYANPLDVAGIAVGNGAVVTERIFLKDANTLQIDAVLEAPEILTAPAKVTYVYNRGKDYTMSTYTACPQYDRLVDPKTGLQRFDLEPPSDLPPPPAN